MYLIQLLLPLYDNDQQALPKSSFRAVRDELIERFRANLGSKRLGALLLGLGEEIRFHHGS